MITFHADILIMQLMILVFNIRSKWAARLINSGAFRTIYYEFKNRFETRIDVEVKSGIRVWIWLRMPAEGVQSSRLVDVIRS